MRYARGMANCTSYGCRVKVCKVCQVKKLRSAFHADPEKKDGVKNICIECRSANRMSKVSPIKCGSCSRYQPLAKNDLCKRCNKIKGLRTCKKCDTLCGIWPNFDGDRTTCKDCRKKETVKKKGYHIGVFSSVSEAQLARRAFLEQMDQA